MQLLFIGTAEVILIVFAVLLLFGSKKIPEVARAIGKGYREFQKATEDIKRELSDLEKDEPKTTYKKESGNPVNPNPSENQ
ncbi:MAG: twin-arginine translocase TatA/TatE family subunit [Tenuifilaceae bacterium]|jgi:TatA/E family protein of Tat protein translocase|nr:twin-arginine translocase TatA/TatE family subunit [Tenuifilaceae bacterium]